MSGSGFIPQRRPRLGVRPLFAWRAGCVGYTFSRASAATQRSSAGVVETVSSGRLRDGRFILNPATGLYERATLVEPQATNYLARSDALTTSPWTSFGSVTTTGGQADPFGGTTGISISDNDGSVFGGYYQNFTIPANASMACSVFVKKGTSARSTVLFDDTTTGLRKLQLMIDWNGDGTIATLSTSTGSNSGYELIASGWYRVWGRTTTLVAGNTGRVYLMGADVAGTGSTIFAGAQADDAPFPFSYFPTTTAAAARAAESLYFAFTAVPQEMTVYARFYEMGSALLNTGQRVLQIGSTAGVGTPALSIYVNTGTGRYQSDVSNLTSAASSGQPATGPAFRDLVELRLTLSAAGAAQLFQSLNGGAEASGTASTAVGLAASWVNPVLWFGSLAGSFTGASAFTHVYAWPGTRALAYCRLKAGL